METELIQQTGGIIGAVQGVWQFAGLLVIILFVTFLLIRQDSKLKAQTDKETAERVKTRDEQMLKHDNRMDNHEHEICEIKKGLDHHKNEEHSKRDGWFTKELASVDSRLKVIEQNLIKKEEFNKLQETVYIIKEGVATIKAVINERTGKNL